MISLKKALTATAIASLLGVGAVAATATSASAYVVCNAVGDCWHTDRHYQYDTGLRVQMHPDSWYFHRDWDHDNTYHWRQHHDGRGYFRNGVWVTF